MLGLFDKPFDSLDATDLRDLVERKIREHLQLDYKEEAYEPGHKETVEMLADVTSMANSAGGYLIIGISEEKEQLDGTPKEVKGIPDGGKQARRIKDTCLGSIDPKIPGLVVREIPIDESRSCVVVQIPNSVRKPHMIVHENHRSFRMRHGREKAHMNVDEVRSMILNMNAYSFSLTEFIESRKQALGKLSGGLPWLMLMVTPIYVGNDKVDPLRLEIRELLRDMPGHPNDDYQRINFENLPMPRIFGVEATRGFESPGDGPRYVQLRRNGHLEFGQRLYDIKPQDSTEGLIVLYPAGIAVKLINFLEVARRLLVLAEIIEPIAITLHLQNISPSALDYRSTMGLSFNPNNKLTFTWNEPRMSLSLTANELNDVEYLACQLVDRLYYAYGSFRRKSFLFDEAGRYVEGK